MRTYTILIAVLAAGLWPGSAGGQTLFVWPDTAVDVSRYKTIGECAAAVTRVRPSLTHQEYWKTQVWRDTLPYDPAERLERLPSELTELVRRCIGRHATPNSVRLADWLLLVPLYLLAEWDARADSLVERRLTEIEDGADRELAAVLDTVSIIYIGTRSSNMALRPHPPRLDRLDEILTRHVPRLADRAKQVPIYLRAFQAMAAAEGGVDTTRVERARSRLEALLSSLDESEREPLREILAEQFHLSPFDGDARLSNWLPLIGGDLLGREETLAMLRRSTAEYAEYLRGLWERVTGQPPETFPLPLGERAQPLEAKFWLGCDDTCGPRPTPGRTSLVVFFNHAVCNRGWRGDLEGMDQNCAKWLIPIRRLMERFPELEVTFVTRSMGYFGYLKEGVTPDVEAELTRKWLDAFGMHAPLAVVETDFWRLPGHDRRRINEPSENEMNYSFEKSWSEWETTYLIDEDGLIVLPSRILRLDEAVAGKMIEVLFARKAAQT